jgi:hypothetical protein
VELAILFGLKLESADLDEELYLFVSLRVLNKVLVCFKQILREAKYINLSLHFLEQVI